MIRLDGEAGTLEVLVTRPNGRRVRWLEHCAGRA